MQKSKMNKTKAQARIITTIVCGIIGLILIAKLIVGICYSLKWDSSTNLTAAEAKEKLTSADQITLVKNYATVFKKDYWVIVDGEAVAKVTGLNFFERLGQFGEDKFTLSSTNGDMLAYEREEKLHLNKQACFYDKNNTITGRYESKYFSILPAWDWKDSAGNVKSKIKFSLSVVRHFKVTNTNSEVEYDVKGNLWLPTYTITLKSESATISPENVILITCVNDVILSSDNDSSDKNKN